MKDIVVFGKVSSVYPEKRTARVLREDSEVVSAELKVLDRGDSWFPEVGDTVLCLFFRVGTDGVILGEV